MDDHPGRSADPLRIKHGARRRITPLRRDSQPESPHEQDPASGVGILTALAAGIVSFLSPCVLPLVPGYLSAVTGVAAADLEQANWRRVIVPSLLFVSSFSVDLHPARPRRNGDRQHSAGAPASARQDRRMADHRDGLVLRLGALHPAAQPGMARRGPPGPGRDRRSAGRRRRVRLGLDALHRPHAGGHPKRRRALGLRRPRRPSARRLLGRPRDSLPAHLDRLHTDDDGLRRRQAPLPGDHGHRRPDPDRVRRRDPDRLVRHLQPLGAGPARQPRHQLSPATSEPPWRELAEQPVP